MPRRSADVEYRRQWNELRVEWAGLAANFHKICDFAVQKLATAVKAILADASEEMRDRIVLNEVTREALAKFQEQEGQEQ